MLVRVLGSAAGGAVPQWNCGCLNCRAARDDKSLCRTTCSLAVSGDGAQWVLLNAAGDLPFQFASFQPLHPPAGTRASPLAGVVLTDAELDHVLGLLALRQAARLHVAGTPGVRGLLERSGLLRLLRGYLALEWQEIATGAGFPLNPSEPAGLQALAFAVGTGKPPAYAGPQPVRPDVTVGLQLTDPRTSGCLVYLPVLPVLTDELAGVLQSASLILLDGTFFSEMELTEVQGNRTARQLGHLPIDDPDGSLARLDPKIRSRVVYTHLNNTNPLLDPKSSASRKLGRTGAAVAADGQTYEL
jgi:pyrroloquinoline quinone biosynthesis protein B